MKRELITRKIVSIQKDEWVFSIDEKEDMMKTDEYIDKWKETMIVRKDDGKKLGRHMRITKYVG